MATDSAPPSKIARLEGTDPSTDPNSSRDFDTETQKALEEIDSCQNEIDSLNEKASEEILKVEQKYNKLRKPHYEKRNELIQKIPRFWLTAFLNHPQISAILDEDEEECLQHLKQVEVEEFEDIKSGYKIKLIFESNPFFKETMLVKEFHLATSGEPECKSTQITWTEGKNLVERAESNQNKALKKGMKRNMQQDRTFFQWFLDEADPSCDDIAEVLKDDMWPNPLQYFLASDLENGYDEEDDDDDLDEEDEDDDDEDGVEIIGEDTGDIDDEDDEDLDEDDDGEGGEDEDA